MSSDLSFINLILDASLVVQLVIFSLLLTSISSWVIIFNKRGVLKQAKSDADSFEEHFWSLENLSTLYNRIRNSRYQPTGMEKIFEAGFSESEKLLEKGKADADAMLEGAQRAMRVAMSKETDDLETNLSFLATVGSTSPYVGLFGTVWGIMNSFRALGQVQQATIAMVAPGISEALVATAMGLFAAIPAVIAYNRYSNEVERLISRYDAFMEEFSSILHRHAHT